MGRRDRGVEARQMDVDERMPRRSRGRAQVLERRAQPPADLDRARPVGPDLVEREVEDVAPARRSATPAARSRRRRARRTPPGRAPAISRTITSRTSMPWTAVVGSLTAGESARIAVSTMMRMAKAGSCSTVRSSPISTPSSRRVVVERRPARGSAGGPAPARRTRRRRGPARPSRPPPRRAAAGPRGRTTRSRPRERWTPRSCPGRAPRRRASAAPSVSARGCG